MAGYLSAPPRAATQARNVQGSVTGNSLVENRLTGLLGRDSAYMRQAETRGLQQSAARGQLSTSMAIGEVEDSRIAAGIPIASQDAGTYAAMNTQNVGYQQQGALNEQNYGNAASLADQGFGNNTSLQAQGIQGQKDLSAQGYQQNRGLAEQGFGFDTRLSAQGYQQDRGLAEQGFGFNTQLQDQQGQIQSSLSAQGYGQNSQLQSQQGDISSRLAAEGFGYDTQARNQQGQINSDLATQGFQQQGALDGENRAFSADQQARQSVANATANYDAQASAIRANPNMNQAEKAAALTDLQTTLNASTTIATRGTALQGQFTFRGTGAPGQTISGSAANAGSPPLQPAGQGMRWAFDTGTQQWTKVPA